MICPHCGTKNNSSRFHCINCGESLSETPKSATKKKQKHKPANTTFILLGIALATLLIGIVHAENAGPKGEGIITLGVYMLFGIFPGVLWLREVNRQKAGNLTTLWLYRVIFMLLGLFAWPGLLLLLLLRSRANDQFRNPLKVVAILAAAIVFFPYLIVQIGKASSDLEFQQRQNLSSRAIKTGKVAI